MLLMDLSSWLAAGHEEQIALGVGLLGLLEGLLELTGI